MKILVLGGGFVGAPVASYLAKQGHSVACATRSGMLSLQAMLAGVEPFGLAMPDALLPILDRVEPEAVIHLAGPAGDVACRAHPRHAVEAHATLAMLLADVVQRWKPHLRVLYGSSHLVFEDAEIGRTSEDDVPRTGSLYGTLKVAGEALLKDVPRTCIVRMPHIYGDGLDPRRLGVIERMLRACLAREALEINAHACIDLLHVEDFARLLLRLLSEPAIGGIVHATGEWLTMRNLGYKMRAASAYALGFEPDLVEHDGTTRARVRSRLLMTGWARRHTIIDTAMRTLRQCKQERVHAHS